MDISKILWIYLGLRMTGLIPEISFCLKEDLMPEEGQRGRATTSKAREVGELYRVAGTTALF